MKSRKLLFNLLSLLVFTSLLAACGGAPTAAPATEAPATEMPATEMPATEAPATEAPATEAPADPMADLVAAAQAEGTLTTIALPHDWCNYGEVIDTFKSKYGLEVNELNPDAGSGDEVEAIKANKDNPGPQAPDVIDVGFSFGSSSKEEGLIQPYKVSTWDTIPDDAKDPEGYWYGDYYGVLSFLVNTDVQPDVPQDWADLLDPKYNGQVALSGDPRTSNQAGNLVPLIANNGLVATGETAVRITWDYNGLAAIDSFEGNPAAEVVVPASGRFAGVYVQAISAYAPHPNAAMLWMEFLYSDEGQLLWMKGYCHPIREADLRDRGVIPEDLLAKLPDVSGAVFPTLEQLNAASELITTNWDSAVGADIQAAP
jgi:putative spermidine/putrescine transport system substrate-binding protein